MILSGKARLAGVLGWPVTHSLSPRLHGYWLEQHGIDGSYLPLAAKPKALSTVVSALVELGFRGFNVTIPHKEAVRGLCHALDSDAERIGAVNTVVIEDGRLRGSNSDAFGFIENLRHAAPAWKADAGPAAVIGAGGAARAVIVALLDAGVPEIRLTNRTFGRAEALASQYRPVVQTVSWGDDAALLDGVALLVNCTSLGMDGQPPLDLKLNKMPRNTLVTDLVYAPLETPLLAAARERGNPTVDGLGMLLHQARRGFAAWFEVEPTVTEELRRFVLTK